MNVREGGGAEDCRRGNPPSPSIRPLAEDIRGELNQMEVVVEELTAIAGDVGEGPVSLRDRAAASAFLASFYMGVENILKRIIRYHDMDLPSGDRWHVELFERFCTSQVENTGVDFPSTDLLPVLFDGDLVRQMDAYRRFRHVIHHGYERDLDYDRMRPGVEGASGALEAFRDNVERYVNDIARE